MHGVSDSLGFDDIIEFMTAAKVDKSCPACGATKWSIIHHGGMEGEVGYPLVPVGNREDGLSGYTLPVIFCICKRCAFMRMHSRTKIARWVVDGKKAFEDAEE